MGTSLKKFNQELMDLAETCPDGTPPMEKWLDAKDQTEKECRTCNIAVFLPEYQKVLTKNGYPELAEGLADAMAGDGDIIGAVAKSIDELKDKVSPEVQAVLRGLDCLTQTTTPE